MGFSLVTMREIYILSLFKRKTRNKNLEDIQLDTEKLPKHVAMIMDGNGRWAKSKNMPRSLGHRAGVEALRNIIQMTSDLGIKYLSLYAFSTENWARPNEEVSVLMSLLVEFLAKEIDELNEKNVKIVILGDITKFPQAVRKQVEYAVDLTKNNTGLQTNIALNYGGRAEIVNAAKQFAIDVKNGKDIDSLTVQNFNDYLYTKDMPDPDLLIRTSGEMRLSNFLLYQLAYAEFIFPETFWPDFDKEQYKKVLVQYTNRDRRFGGLSKDKRTV